MRNHEYFPHYANSNFFRQMPYIEHLLQHTTFKQNEKHKITIMKAFVKGVGRVGNI